MAIHNGTFTAQKAECRQPLLNMPAILLLACAPAAVALATVNESTGYQRGLTIVSVAALVFGACVFWSHGGRQITAAGVYSLSSAAFVGWAGLWWARDLGDQVPASLFTAALAAYLTHIGMYVLFWQGQHYAENPRSQFVMPNRVSRTAVVAGTLSLGVGVLLAETMLTMRALIAPALGFAGVVILSLGLAASRERKGLSLPGLVIIGTALAVYILTIFTGYGRLMVVTLLTACGIILASRFGGRLVKASMMVGAPLIIIVLSRMRNAAVEARYGVRFASPEDPDSVQSPLQVFAKLLDSSVPFTHGHGSTFWSAGVTLVPRHVWNDKPVQFGAELTKIFHPDLVAAGHSEAALSAGEWYFNFGIVGLVAMVLVLGWSIRRLDGFLARSLNGDGSVGRTLMRFGLAVTLIAGMGDMMWNGTGTFASRAVFRAIAVAALALLVDLCARRTQDPVPQVPYRPAERSRRSSARTGGSTWPVPATPSLRPPATSGYLKGEGLGP